jgi:hypothetical protein
MRLVIGILAVLCFIGSTPAQQIHRQQNSEPPAKEAAPAVDPDVEKFKRVFDLQATEDQERKFRGMTASTQLAGEHARELEQQAAASQDTIPLMHRATTLEDDIDQALTDYRIFRRSLSDPQEAEMKKQMKKVIASVHAVSKAAETLSQELNRIPVNPAKVRSLAERLDNELMTLQAAQATVGREMSIPLE